MTTGDISQFFADYGLTMAIIFALIVVSAFFSGSETALTAVSRARMHTLEQQGDRRAGFVNAMIARRDRLIGALLIGNNLVNILASSLTTPLFLSIFGDKGVAYATLIMTTLLVIFAEVLPKSWAISATDRPCSRALLIVSVLVARISPHSSNSASPRVSPSSIWAR